MSVDEMSLDLMYVGHMSIDSLSAHEMSVDKMSTNQMGTGQMSVNGISVHMTFYQMTLHRNTFFPIRFSAATWTRQRSDGTTSISRSLPGSSGFIRWPGTRGSASVPVSVPYTFFSSPFMLRLNKLECLSQKSFLCVNGCLFLYC
jgi:hypothetical protein